MCNRHIIGNLFVMNADWSNVHQIAHSTLHEGHPALTPDGRVARYLYGIQFDPRTLRLSLVEAADGKIGTTRDRFLRFCFNYDATAGRYGPAARNIMKAGGLLTMAALAILILAFRRRERKRQQRRPSVAA